MDPFADFLLPGLIFLALSVRWTLTLCQSLSKDEKKSYKGKSNDDTTSIIDPSANVCFQTAYGLPWEGLIKLILSGSGIVLTVLVADPIDAASITHISNATLYLFLALSGLTDVVAYYGGSSLVPSTLPSAVLTIHFLVEAWLVACKKVDNELDERMQNGILLAVFACIATSLWRMFLSGKGDVLTPRLAQIFSCLLQATWLCHCAIIAQVQSQYSAMTLEWISLLFAWHVATDLILVVIVVLLHRQRLGSVDSCLPIVFDASIESHRSYGKKDETKIEAKECPVSPVSTVAFSTFIANVQQQQQQTQKDEQTTIKPSSSPIVIEAEPHDRVVLGQYEYRSLAREEALRASIRLKESSLI